MHQPQTVESEHLCSRGGLNTELLGHSNNPLHNNRRSDSTRSERLYPEAKKLESTSDRVKQKCWLARRHRACKVSIKVLVKVFVPCAAKINRDHRERRGYIDIRSHIQTKLCEICHQHWYGFNQTLLPLSALTFPHCWSNLVSYKLHYIQLISTNSVYDRLGMRLSILQIAPLSWGKDCGFSLKDWRHNIN